jgi:hypothetical protein
MKFVTILMLISILFSCKEATQESEMTPMEIAESQVILHEEYSGEEPTKPEETEFYKPVVPVVGPGDKGRIPQDAIVLFDGSSFEGWVHSQDSTAVKWHLNKDGSMTVADKTGNIQTTQNFGDVQLHIEWKSPAQVEREGQNRGNSGVYLNGLYEVQILDNNDNSTYVNGQVGSIYKQYAPMAMASVASGEWNVYDIVYHAPEFNEIGGKIKSGTLTVFHNGVLIQDNAELKGTTEYIGWPKNKAHGKGPIMLQDHGDNSRVGFRNIWVREL